jgi:hypothetical protein
MQSVFDLALALALLALALAVAFALPFFLALMVILMLVLTFALMSPFLLALAFTFVVVIISVRIYVHVHECSCSLSRNKGVPGIRGFLASLMLEDKKKNLPPWLQHVGKEVRQLPFTEILQLGGASQCTENRLAHKMPTIEP